MVYAVAGMLFGFVLGYMVANAGSGPRPSGAPATPALPMAASGPATRRAPPLDANEVKALESLAAREAANAQVRVELGNLLMDHEQYEGAARWYREALGLTPDNADVRVDLGACLVNMGRPGEALAEFETDLKKQPGHKKALYNKGIALVESGRPKEGAALWEDLLKRYPGDPMLAGLRGQIEQMKQRAASAP